MNAVFKLLNPDNTVTVNRPLAHALGTNEAIIYSALIGKKAYYEQSNKLDEDGWFYSTIKDLQESTCLTRSQQDSAIKNLTDAKLIECKRKGTPARRHFWVNTDEEIIAELLKKGEEIMRSLNPIVQKSDKQDCRKSANKFAENPQTCLREIDKPTYNPNNKKPKEKNPNQSIPADAGDGIDRIDERESYLELIHENIDYDYLTDKSEKEKIDQLVEIMLDVICSTKDTVRVNGEDVPREVVKSRFLKLDSSHVDYVLTSLGKNTTDVRNIRAYLITALYNAPATIDSYYTAWVNHDMYGGS